MGQTTRFAAAALAACAACLLWTRPLPAADAAKTEVYVVRRGDTLAGISARVLGSPKRWREILQANPQVTNPNRIYPGDSLTVPVPETAAAGSADLQARQGAGAAPATGVAGGAPAGGAVPTAPAEAAPAAPAGGGEPAPGAGAGNGAMAVEPQLPVEQVRSIPVVSPAVYRNAGYLTDALPAVAIVASQDQKDANGSDDAVILNTVAPPGTRFAVVRANRRVFHPRTGASLGWVVTPLGRAEVTCAGTTTSTAVLRGMRDAAGVGDYVVALREDDLEENQLAPRVKSECVAGGPEDAMIVAFDEERHTGSEGDFAYIDRGVTAGATPGKRFAVYRDVEPGSHMMIGEVQVLRAGASTATVLITTSLREITVADLLRAR
jgi:nucleoid-associated protein YgaU